MTPSTKLLDSRQVGTIWFEKNLTNSSQDGSSDGFVPVRLDHGWRDRQVSRTSVYFDEKSEACYTGRRDFCVGCRRVIVSYVFFIAINLLWHELCTSIHTNIKSQVCVSRLRTWVLHRYHCPIATWMR
jgi:hypothetical protein